MHKVSVIFLGYFSINNISVNGSQAKFLTLMTNSTKAIISELLEDDGVIHKLPAHIQRTIAERKLALGTSGNAGARGPGQGQLPGGRSLPTVDASSSTEASLAEIWFSMMSSYGCWCTMNSEYSGRGIPVDSYDMTCKNLSEAYGCSQNEPWAFDCQPWTQEYNTPENARLISSPEEVVAACDAANSGASDCVKNSCYIQLQYVLDMFDSLFGDGFNEMFLHDKGFDPELHCQRRPPKMNTDLQCCGAFPKRKLYNAQFNNCCEDGTVKFICD